MKQLDGSPIIITIITFFVAPRGPTNIYQLGARVFNFSSIFIVLFKLLTGVNKQTYSNNIFDLDKQNAVNVFIVCPFVFSDYVHVR